jgi:tRNA threonylcarbamoyl adenosine modification protein YeaZ
MFDANALTLLVDCALKTSVVALSQVNKILASAGSNGEQSHSITLLAAIDQTLSQAGKSLSQIQQVVFSNGPGGFSSLRVGLATLTGLFIGSDAKLFPVSSLLLRCLSQTAAKKVVSVMRGNAGQVFIGYLHGADFQEEASSVNDAILRLQTFAPEIICGDGVKELLAAGFAIGKAVVLPDLVLPEAFLKVGIEHPLASVGWGDARLSYFREAI